MFSRRTPNKESQTQMLFDECIEKAQAIRPTLMQQICSQICFSALHRPMALSLTNYPTSVHKGFLDCCEDS